MIARLFKNFLPFMQPEGSVLCPQEPDSEFLTLSHMNLVHNLRTFSVINVSFVLPCKPKSPQWFLPLGFMTKIYEILIFSLRATCPSQYILLDLFTMIMNCWTTHDAVFSNSHSFFSFGPNNLLGYLLFHRARTRDLDPYKTEHKIIILYILSS